MYRKKMPQNKLLYQKVSSVTYFVPFLILKRITVVPGFRVLGFSALPGFSALNAGDGAWLVHKTLFGFEAPI